MHRYATGSGGYYNMVCAVNYIDIVSGSNITGHTTDPYALSYAQNRNPEMGHTTNRWVEFQGGIRFWEILKKFRPFLDHFFSVINHHGQVCKHNMIKHDRTAFLKAFTPPPTTGQEIMYCKSIKWI